MIDGPTDEEIMDAYINFGEGRMYKEFAESYKLFYGIASSKAFTREAAYEAFAHIKVEKD